MKKDKNRTIVFVIITLMAAALFMTLTSFMAVEFFVGNMNVFFGLIVVVPVICVALAAFVIGYLIRWNWRKGLCIAIVLALISFGTGELAALVAGKDFENAGAEDSVVTADDEFMNELYDELDKKAYQYMLEQGLISEGEQVYGEGNIIDGKEGEDSEHSTSDNEIVGSELYIGIQKSDTTSELMGSFVDFAVGFGFSFVGYRFGSKLREKKLVKQEAQANE